MEKGKYRKTRSGHPLAKLFVFNNVKSRPLICFRRKRKLLKLTFTKTEILPNSLPCHCGEIDYNRVHVVPSHLPQDPCWLWEDLRHMGKATAILLTLLFYPLPLKARSSLGPVQMAPRLPVSPLTSVWSILTASLAKELPPDGIIRVSLTCLRIELAKSQSFRFIGNSNILNKKYWTKLQK